MNTDIQQTPPQPAPDNGGDGDITQAASGAAQKVQQQQQPQQQPVQPQEKSPVSVVSQPNIVKPDKRGGLAGVLDEIADAVAGTKGPGKVYTDGEGNQYIEHPALSRKQQWLKIASEAVHGAGAGASVKSGPGQVGRAFGAGVNEGDQMEQREHQRDQEQTQEVRQANQDHFNQIKLKHDFAAQEFLLSRMKVNATHSDVQFSQGQEDRMRGLVNDGKAFDLGTYKDEADLARIKDVNPTFWKDVYKNDITVVPVLGEDGERKGIHVYKTTPGIGSELVTPGTPFKVFAPPAKPGDPPKLEDHIPTVPMTWNQKHAYDLAAATQMQKWQTDQEGEKLKKSEVSRNNAEANKDNAEAKKAAEKTSGTMGYAERTDGTVWITSRGEAEQNGVPFQEMKPGDINKDKQAMRQLNDVQLNSSRYTRAAKVYADPQAPLTYRGKPVSAENPVHISGWGIDRFPGAILGFGSKITSAGELRERDNTNLNTLMNKAGYADMEASISAGGHVTVPVLTAFSESLSREINSKAYNELSDQGKDLYDGYLRTLAAIPAYVKVLTNIGRSNKETLDLELANIKHPGYAPKDILRGQDAFQQNIDRAADGFPRNMVGIAHPADVRRKIEQNGGNPELPPDVMNLLESHPPSGIR